MSFYEDLYVDNDDDFVFTKDGDIKTAENGRVVAQDIKEGILAAKGDILWSPETGQGMGILVKDNDVSDRTVISLLRSEAIGDVRVDPDSVKAGIDNVTGRFYLDFTLYHSPEPEKLLFDKRELLEGDNAAD